VDLDESLGDGELVEGDLLLRIVWIGAGSARLGDDGDSQRIDERGQGRGVEDRCSGFREGFLGAEREAGGGEAGRGEKAAAGDQSWSLLKETG